MPLPQIDPVAAWGTWGVTVRLASGPVEIPALPAAHWLEAAWHGGRSRYVLDLAAPETCDRLSALLMDGDLELDELDRAGRDALEAASGWRWWIAENLMLAYGAVPALNGELVLRGVRPQVVGIGEWMAAAYALLVSGREPKEVAAFDQKLVMPPPGVEGADDILEEMAAELFGQMVYAGADAAPFPGG